MKSINSSFLFLLCFFALISLQTTCQKAEPRVLLTNDTTFLSYWYFQTNSYWIYEDSVNGELDTFRITWNDVREGPNDRYSNYKLQVHVIHLLNKGLTKYLVGIPVVLNNSEFIFDLQQNNEDCFGLRFFYDPNNGIKSINEGKLFIVQKLDTIKIRNFVFYNVFQMGSRPQSENDTIRKEYYAQNIGVIKRVYQNNHVWELKEYYIAP